MLWKNRAPYIFIHGLARYLLLKPVLYCPAHVLFHPIPRYIAVRNPSLMKRFLLTLLIPVSVSAQNLVPNPGFEELLQIPCNCMQNNMSQYVRNWDAVSPGTSDILTDQAEPNCYANPNSAKYPALGTQAPHGGHAYAMIMTYCDDKRDYREYIGVKLKQPLIPGKKYYAEMYVSLADYSGYYTNNLGISFFTGEMKKWSEYVILHEPQVNQTAMVDNCTGWVKVSGTFVAAEAYTFLVIGNFISSANTNHESRNVTVPGQTSGFNSYRNYAGYYIDDIVVKRASTLAVSGDTLVPAGNIASLMAVGSKTYAWADSAKPAVILGKSPALKLAVEKRRTFYVYGDDDTAMITVNVSRPQILKELNGRKVKKGRVVPVENNKITITVFDNNKIDGDSISLYYGDSCIVESYKLTKKKKSFTIYIDKEHPRQLILYAVNQGEMPPNTASVIISDGKNSTSIVLSSDLKTCDSIQFMYKE